MNMYVYIPQALPPDGGDALIYGRSVRSAAGLTAIRSTLGVCPQFDVLWGELTGAEHLRLFAAMKGMAQGEVEAEVGLQLEKVRGRMACPWVCQTGGRVSRFGVEDFLVLVQESTSQQPGNPWVYHPTQHKKH